MYCKTQTVAESMTSMELKSSNGHVNTTELEEMVCRCVHVAELVGEENERVLLTESDTGAGVVGALRGIGALFRLSSFKLNFR